MKLAAIFSVVLALFTVNAASAHASAESRALFAAEASWFWHKDVANRIVVFDHGEYRCNEPGVVGYADMPGREIHFCLNVWQQLTVAQRCHAWIHEAGHTLGHDHQRRGVMAPVMRRPIAVCRWWARFGDGRVLRKR